MNKGVPIMNNKEKLLTKKGAVGGALIGLIAFSAIGPVTPAFADVSVAGENVKIKAENTKYGTISYISSNGTTKGDGGNGGNDDDDNDPPVVPPGEEPLMVFTMGTADAGGNYTKPVECSAVATRLTLGGVSSGLVFTSPTGVKTPAVEGVNTIPGWGIWTLSGGTFESFGAQAPLNHNTSCMTSVDTWRNTGTVSLDYGFYNGAALKKINEIPTTVETMRGTFSGGTANPNLDGVVTSKVKNMDAIFNTAKNFNNGDVPGGNTKPLTWDIRQVTTLNMAFANAESFNQPLNSWNTSNVDNMGSTFTGAVLFNQPLSNWNTSKVTYMGSMFESARAFNRPLATDGNKWNTSNVINMSRMFNDARAFDQTLTSWNITKVNSFANFATGSPIVGTSKVPNFN